MIKDENYTEFAPAERASQDEVLRLYHLINEQVLLKEVIDAIPDIFLILNSKRQIVFANSRLLEYSRQSDLTSLLGKRPGELFMCVHSFENPGGCGTTLFCSECGAANAILDSYSGIKSSYECRINAIDNKAYDLKVFAAPYNMFDELLSFFTLQDISNEKRRQALEKVFYHDVMNTIGNLHSIAQLLKENPAEIEEFNDIIYNISETLIEQIISQKELSAAENGELSLHITELTAREILNKIKDEYLNSPYSINRKIIIDENTSDIQFESDRVLIKRVVGNLLKNALEATEEGGSVILKAAGENDKVIFSVHNDFVIPLKVKLKLFQRSFSTKGEGRGLGTYSVKLLTENYLKGKVEFISEEGLGTTFTITLNKKFLNKKLSYI